jgi:L-threonylcarbamoyladenylate synthase
MAEFVFLQPRPESGMLRLADAAVVADHLRQGGLAVLPTETGYMLAALATSEPALIRAFAVKARDHAQVMHVACSSLAMVATVGVLSERASRLLGEFTPGPLSVIVEKTARLPDRLVTMQGTVGIRVPDHPATLQVIAEVGIPLTATSLNRSGEPYVPITEAGLSQLAWPDGEVVPVVEDPSAKRYDDASALVRVTGPEPEVLRAGPIDEARIREALERYADDPVPQPARTPSA